MISHPFLDERLNKKNILLCVIASDTGLCGPYNNNVIRASEAFLKKYQPDKVRLVTVGKKGFIHFNKKGFKVTNSYVGLNGRYSSKVCEGMLKVFIDMFLLKQVDEVYIAYTHPETASRRKPVIEKLLNIGRLPGAEPVDYIYETPISVILDDLIPLYLSNKIKTIMLDSFTSEHQARAIAMGEATENATDILSSLILMRNKVRQANITKEMLEIVSSAEALKG
jgi:F-type H+-transporting ATPase subunit gamma